MIQYYLAGKRHSGASSQPLSFAALAYVVGARNAMWVPGRRRQRFPINETPAGLLPLFLSTCCGTSAFIRSFM